MADQNVFEKRHIDPSKMGRVEGLLEHLNLPPSVVSYYRHHAALVKSGVLLLIVVVVSLSLYGSWQKQQLEKSNSALTAALTMAEDKRPEALAGVMKAYSATPAALWAEVELAHQAMQKKDFGKATAAFNTLLTKTAADNPLQPLLIYGIAQTEEGQGNHGAALAAYEKLRGYQTYQTIAIFGLAQISEKQGDTTKAIDLYSQYKTKLAGNADQRDMLALLDEKIAQLKGKL